MDGKALARRILDEIVNQGSLDAADELGRPEPVSHADDGRTVTQEVRFPPGRRLGGAGRHRRPARPRRR